VIDCVILWDYYAFITYKTFQEAERALIALNGFTWKDRNLIVEWSRASGRRQQQQTSPIPPRLGSELSTSSHPRPSTLLTSNGQFYGNNSPMKSPSFNPNLTLMSNMQQPFLYHHPSISYNNEILANDNQQIFDGLTRSSSNHRLDLSPFIDTNSNPLFSSSSELNTPSSAASIYQPSDIIALLEPLTPDVSVNNKSIGNSSNDLTNLLSSTVPPSCSSAALLQENIISSLFHTFEPFKKFFPTDDQSSSSRYNHLSPLLTTAPDQNHYPISYGHNISWH
jgi:RNA recognition motif-containing protein